jgi:RNA polymerase-binding transcription factor DksA
MAKMNTPHDQARAATPAAPAARLGRANPLTDSQRALLQAALMARVRELDGRLAQHHEGATRAEHAHELLERDADDASQQAMDREVDLGLSDLETRELDALGLALARIHEPGFGLCTDCAAEIPFERLKVEPQAVRCVACATQIEHRKELMK